MAESQRKQTSSGGALQSDKQSIRDNLTLVGFLIGGIGLVAGMLWLADGLSQNFKLLSTSFLTFAICMSITATLFIVNKFVIRD